MEYKCHEGIVLTQIAGKWFLIPTRKASEDCTDIVQLTLPFAMIWNLLSKESPLEEVYKIHKMFFKKGDEVAKNAIDKFLSDLYKKGYLIEKQEA